MSLIPKTRLGNTSVLLIFLMFILLIVGVKNVDLYEGIAAGDTILNDIKTRPLVGLPMILAFTSGIASFISGLIAITKHKDRSILVYISSTIGGLLLFFLMAEIAFPY